MSRAIANPVLSRLCGLNDLAVTDIAILTGVSRQSISIYASGRKPLPLVESKLAILFKLPVPAFRRTMFSNRNRSSHASVRPDPDQVRHAHVFTLWEYRPGASQDGTYRNGGHRWTAFDNFREFQAEVRALPRGGKIVRRGIRFAICAY